MKSPEFPGPSQGSCTRPHWEKGDVRNRSPYSALRLSAELNILMRDCNVSITGESLAVLMLWAKIF